MQHLLIQCPKKLSPGVGSGTHHLGFILCYHSAIQATTDTIPASSLSHAIGGFMLFRVPHRLNYPQKWSRGRQLYDGGSMPSPGLKPNSPLRMAVLWGLIQLCDTPPPPHLPKRRGEKKEIEGMGDLLTWQCLLTRPTLTVRPRGHMWGQRQPILCVCVCVCDCGDGLRFSKKLILYHIGSAAFN